jgi:hypothetical protein
LGKSPIAACECCARVRFDENGRGKCIAVKKGKFQSREMVLPNLRQFASA